MWTEQEYMDMFFEEDANEDMIYTVGDDVRYARTGQFGMVTEVDGFNRVYTVDIEGVEYTVSEDELSIMEKEKIKVYHCNSFEAANELFDKFQKMGLKDLDKKRFFDLYNKGMQDIGFCVRFNTWQVCPTDSNNLFDVTLIEM